jgi:hypothetical protein
MPAIYLLSGLLRGQTPTVAPRALGRLPVLDLPHNPPSTVRRHTSIFVHVHPALRKSHEASTTSASSIRDRMDNLLKAHS